MAKILELCDIAFSMETKLCDRLDDVWRKRYKITVTNLKVQVLYAPGDNKKEEIMRSLFLAALHLGWVARKEEVGNVPFSEVVTTAIESLNSWKASYSETGTAEGHL